MGALLTIAGIVMLGKGDISILGLVLGGIFTIIWLFSRQHIISVSSDGGSSLNILVKGMSEEKIENFITSIQDAKLKRVNQLYK